MKIGDGWGEVYYYRNNGNTTTPSWVREDAMFAGIEVDQNAHPGFADLDGDARKDMILGEYNGNFTYYKNLFSPLTDVDNENVLGAPDDYVLYRNYPNPFNPSTSIQYTISSTQFVTLEVYDILGREVATLVYEEKPAGTYKVDFNAVGLSSGVYIYTLKVNDVSYSKSMILLK